ncbi:MAG TPA: hypothetical protein VD962_00405 [Rubricoccaceae bacterium]|nr:hypothetical protein [Rubricoccaceae bacterium]
MPVLESGSVRQAWVKAQGGPVTLRLTATNLLAVGARGRLYTPKAQGQTPIGPSITLGSDGAPVTLEPAAAELDTLELHIRFRACAMHEHLDEGEVELHVMQDNQYCPLSRPTRWERKVPFCQSNKAYTWPLILAFHAVAP